MSKIDLATRRIVRTVEFPAGSKPYMLRVSPDGRVVWVQTADARTNVVLDVETMDAIHTESTGKGPVQSAFGPPDGRYGLVTHLEEDFVLAIDRATGLVARQIDVGGSQANASFMPGGAIAYVTLTSRDEVVAIDMAELAVVGRVAAGDEPMGIVLLDSAEQ